MTRPTSEGERRQFRRAVGARVRTLRAQHGWSQEDLAIQAGLHRTFVGAVERGATGMNLDRLPDIAAALEVEPYALVPGWTAFMGTAPNDSWSVPLRLALPETVRHEQAQRQVGPVPAGVAVAVDAECRAALERA